MNKGTIEINKMKVLVWVLFAGVQICLIGAARLSYEMFKISYGKFEWVIPWTDISLNVAHCFAIGMYVISAGCLHLIQNSIFGATNRKYVEKFERRFGLLIKKEADEGKVAKDSSANVAFNRVVVGFCLVIYFALTVVSYMQAKRISLEERGVSLDEVIAADSAYVELSRQQVDAKRNLAIAQGGDKTVDDLINETKGQATWAQENRQKVNAGIANQRMSTLAENLNIKAIRIANGEKRVVELSDALIERRKEIIDTYSSVEDFANDVGPGLLEVLAFGGAMAMAFLRCFSNGVMPIFPVRAKIVNWKTKKDRLAGRGRSKEEKEDDEKEQEEDDFVPEKKKPKGKPGRKRTLAELEQELDEEMFKGIENKTKVQPRAKVEPIPDHIKTIFENSQHIEELLEWYMSSIPCPSPKQVRSKVENWLYLRGLAFCRFTGDQGIACKHPGLNRQRASRIFQRGQNEAAYHKKNGFLEAWVESVNTRLRRLGCPSIRQTALKFDITFPREIIRRGGGEPYVKPIQEVHPEIVFEPTQPAAELNEQKMLEATNGKERIQQ